MLGDEFADRFQIHAAGSAKLLIVCGRFSAAWAMHLSYLSSKGHHHAFVNLACHAHIVEIVFSD